MAGSSPSVLPIYIAVDASDAVKKLLSHIDDGLASVYKSVIKDPFLATKLRFSVVEFSDSPRVRVDLADLRWLDRLPPAVADGTCSYRSVFLDLRSRIPQDVAILKRDGFAVHRPTVLFLSGGCPDDEQWLEAEASLKDAAFRERPNILAFGLGVAAPSVIAAVASRPEWAFCGERGVPMSSLGQVLEGFLTQLVS